MRTLVALAVAAALAAPAAGQESAPRSPPPTWEPSNAPPRPEDDGRRSLDVPDPGRARGPGTIGAAPVVPAGSQAAPLQPDESVSHWRYSIATGVAGKFGGMRLDPARRNPGVLIYVAGQADGLWTSAHRQAVRLRYRLFTGGETEIFVPSDGDLEAAYTIGRPEFRFVMGRFEAGRYPAIGIEVLAQLGTLPCFEGSLPLAGDTMRLYYFLSPVEASFVRYHGAAHVPHSAAWATESDRPVAASTGRLRYTLLLPAAMLISLQGDLVKLWRTADLLAAVEGSIGYQALDRTAVFNLSLRWNSYTRRGLAPETSETASETLVVGAATLAF
ncbi:MAG TPA: hypothetical protein VIW03_10525 [Anaeromyxobacter sp.]